MILCKNGHENPDGTTYCRVCRVYIDATAAVVSPPPPQPPPPVTPKPPPPQPVVALSQTSTSVVAGGLARCELRVQNPGSEADDYLLEVGGVAAAWSTVEPFSLSLAPGASGTAVVTFRPPPEAPPGSVPLEIVVNSQRPDGTRVSVPGTLEVAALVVTPSLTAKLTPPTSEGRMSADFALTLVNRTEMPVVAALSAGDPEGFLAFDVDPATVEIAAGGEIAARVRVRARKRSFLRGERLRPFQVLVVPAGTSPLGVNGVFVQQRYVPLLLMPLAGAMLVIVLFASIVVLLLLILVIFLLLS